MLPNLKPLMSGTAGTAGTLTSAYSMYLYQWNNSKNALKNPQLVVNNFGSVENTSFKNAWLTSSYSNHSILVLVLYSFYHLQAFLLPFTTWLFVPCKK